MSWGEFKQTLAQSMTDYFGQPLRHIPTEKANVNAAAKPVEGMAYDLCGIFDDPSMHEDLQSKGRSNGHRYVKHTTVAPYISVQECDLQQTPKQGDIFEVLERGETYEVTDVCREMDGRTKLKLVQLSRHRPY